MNTKKYALQYAKLGYKIFPVHNVNENGRCSCGNPDCESIGKHPKIMGGFKNGTSDKDQINEWWEKWPDANIGIFADNLFCLDLDKKSGGYESYEQMISEYGPLPETVTVETGGGGKHFYFLTDDQPKNKAGFMPGLDVRANNGYLLAPPSNHVSGNIYKFEKGLSPGKIEMATVPQWLIDVSHPSKKTASKKKKKSNIDLSEKIPVGKRHDTLMSIVSKYRNQGMKKEEAYFTLKGINDNMTSEPLNDIELKQIVTDAFNYSDDTYYLDTEKGRTFFDDRYVMLFLGSRLVVWEKKTNQVRDLKSMCDYFSKYKVKENNAGDEKPKYWNAFRFWYNKTIQRYMDLVFYPNKEKIIDDQYNLWDGFAYDEDPDGNCDLYLKHIYENICSSDQKLYDFLLDWMAQIIQEPEKKTGVAVALRGKPGTGKGVYSHTFGALLGRHYLTVNNIDMLTRGFNAHLLFKILIFSDEAVWGGDKKSENILKNFITEPKEMIEKKGVDAVEVDSFKRLLMSTNNDWVAPVDNNDRRYVIIDVADNQARNRKYFSAIIDQMKDENGYGKLIHILKTRDISERDWSDLPMTAAKMENILRSFSPIEKWFYQNLQEGEKPFGCDDSYYLFNRMEDWGIISTDSVFSKFQKYNSVIHKKNHIDHSQVGKKLQEMIPSLKKDRKSQGGVRSNCYLFPSLEQCRNDFCKYIDFNIDWD